ncbi:CidA/LrgA family protein [Hafnia alvei]|nr:CidA/LrgA family protein [Hafnia alvei]NLS56208.1 CidA/LrgA family protein [Hafnia alvei]
MNMAFSRFTPAVVSSIQVPIQIMVYAGLFVFSEWLVVVWHLPLPANLVGMLLLLLLLACHIVPLKWVRVGSRWLLAEMLLFFVPAVVAVVNYTQLLMVDGWRIFLVIAISSLLVLGTTALVVDRVCRFERAREARKQASIERAGA